ncbi:hypothetical protein MNBD_BACTEROID07-2099 [hydrothermal vent metagenome]|uniref:Permease n=1 Tax=hydrothermal vent metagenome TaxID=652676 RepID=A0A3B0UD35_9ZZZZ
MEKSPQMKPMKQNEEKRSQKGLWIFLGFSVLLYLVVLLSDKHKAFQAAVLFYHLALEIFPFLLVVFVLMVLINLFLKPSTLIKYMGEDSGIKGWLIAILAGILSMGAIYLWFPILKNMMDKGVKPGLVATFLYNRGIKLHWLPVMVLYFDMKYVIILTIVTVLVSVVQGLVINFILTSNGKAGIERGG